MQDEAASTPELLRRWYEAEDREALDEVLRRELPRVREDARRILGPALRSKLESLDVVHDAVEEFLRYGPPFVPEDADRFRGLLARIVRNTIRDRHDWFAARRRQMHRERPLPDESAWPTDAPRRRVATPSEEASRHEWTRWVRLALEVADPDDRRVVLLRLWDALPFAQVGESLGIAEDAARMRYHRALVRLADEVTRLRVGNTPPPGRDARRAQGDES